MIQVGVLVSSPALRAGFRSLLATDASISVIEAVDAQNADPELLEGADVVITTSAPSELPMTRFAEAPLPVAVLFLRDEPLDIRGLLEGVLIWGVLPLNASAVTLCAAVHALAAGLITGSSLLMATSPQGSELRGPLTERETEVLSLLAKGLANKQIALRLGISEHTVKFHVASIYTKLDSTSRTQAVREGLRNGWIML